MKIYPNTLDYYLEKIVNKSIVDKELLKKADSYFPYVVSVMNKLHSVDWTERSWRMLIYGHCLRVLRDTPSKSRNLMYASPGQLGIGNKFKPLMDLLTNLRQFQYIIGALSKKRAINHLLINHNDIYLGEAICSYTNPEQKMPKVAITPFTKRDKSKRLKLDVIANGLKNENLQKILLHMPKLYVEFFSQGIEYAPLIEPSTKRFHVERGMPSLNGLIIAHYLSNGAILNYYQPGGWMGDYESNPGYHNQQQTCHTFFTFGWKIDDNNECGPAFRLKKFAADYSRFQHSVEPTTTSQKILVVISKIHSRNKVGIIEFLKQLKHKIDSTASDKHITVRFRPASRKLKISLDSCEIKLAKTLGFKVDKGYKPMAKAIAMVDLVVHLETPSTNFLECVYVNKPVIAILNNPRPTSFVIPYYKALVDLGVLFVSPNSMIDWIVQQKGFGDWWSEIIDSEGLNNYKNTFCKNSE